MGPSLSDFLKECQSSKCLVCPTCSILIPSSRKGKALSRSIHAGPQTIVVTVVILDAVFDPGFWQRHFGNVAKGGSFDVSFNLMLIVGRFFTQGHRLLPNDTNPCLCGDPNMAMMVDLH